MFQKACEIIPVVLAGIIVSVANAGELIGFAAMEYRQFFQNEQFQQQNFGAIPSLLIEPEYYHSSEDRKHAFVAKLFFRYDPNDDERTHFDIRQADWLYAGDDWEFRAGISKVYWGVTESRHLVDSINQVDGVEDIDEEDRLGQPMIQATLIRDWGSLQFIYLPYFRARTFPGEEGRLRSLISIDADHPQFQEQAEEWYPNFSLRYEHTFGNWDLGLAQFHGTERNPTFILQGHELIPFYQTVNQTSLDLQYTEDAWLWKLEAIFRSSRNDDFSAVTGGFEYSFFGIFDSDHDLGLLAEYHYDGRNSSSPSTLFDNDFFVGARYVFNNVSDSEMLAGVTTDLDGKGTIAIIEASHRFDDHWKIELDARFFVGIEKNDNASFLNKDDFVQFRLSYYF